MRSYILFFSLIFGFQFGLAMEMSQDQLDRQLRNAVLSYYDRNQQSTAVEHCYGLLFEGANPNIIMDNRELTPLLYLMMTKSNHENALIKRNLIELLIKGGTNPNCIAHDPKNLNPINTPLSLCCAPENRLFFNLLTDRGADMHQRFQNNKTILHAAARFWNVELCDFLLKNSLDVNAVDDNGETPLHTACGQDFGQARNMQNNALTTIELLLDWGAQVNVQNNKRETPLHLAIAYNPSRAEVRPIINVLLSRGANLNLLCQWNEENVLKSPLAIATLVRNPRSKKDYKEQRRLCELMMTHQVLVNKGILTLLGSLRKVGLEGNLIARTLYLQREHLLSPYLRRLYVPLRELLQGSNLRQPRRIINLSDFRSYQDNFPNSNFNIDFLDPARITETYRNFNRNIYQGLHQPQIIGLAKTNPAPRVRIPTQVPHDDAYDDYSDDDDNNNIQDIFRARRIAEEQRARQDRMEAEARRNAELQRNREAQRINNMRRQPAARPPLAETPLWTSINHDIFVYALGIGLWGGIGYFIYEWYIDWKESKKEKRKKEEKKNQKEVPSVDSDPVVSYA